MKENKLTITIHKPVEEVFAFTTDPKNTHLWIPFIVKEETDEWPPKIGSIYRNLDKDKVLSELAVLAYEPNKLFELVSKNGNYHVRYSYSESGIMETGLEYFEWVDNGELEKPFTQKILDNLL